MKYNGKSVDLPPESEEVAWFFGSMLNSDHIEKPTFVRNFFNDWREVLKQHPPVRPVDCLVRVYSPDVD
jgi:DNA topoisomerase-1